VSALKPRFGIAWRVLGDIAVAAASLAAAFAIRTSLPLPFTDQLLPEDRWQLANGVWWWLVLAQPGAAYFFGLYDPPRPQPRAELARRVSLTVFLQCLTFAGFLFFEERAFPRSVLVAFALLDVLALFAWRRAIERRERFAERRVAIVGSGVEAVELAQQIEAHHWHGLVIVGFVPTPDAAATSQPSDLAEAGDVSGSLGRRLGSLQDLPRLLAEGLIDDVIVAAPAAGWQATLIDCLGGVRRPAGTSVLVLPGPWESLLGRMRYRWIRDLPLVELVTDSAGPRSPAKRLLDIVGASVLLLGATPLLLLAMLSVRLSGTGPILFRQRRVGMGQRHFTLVKLRTMHADAEADGRERLADTDDPRLTSIGGFLRRSRIDELPQLWNVLRGDMSLVGPRPERPGFVEHFLAAVPGYAERFAVRPGITGLAQVNGEYHSSATNKLRYDLAYIANLDLWLDLSILLRTVKIVLTSRGV
jgi:exopolysaccharide biosynthesis polyprenyl glycosylphosphotransferase